MGGVPAGSSISGYLCEAVMDKLDEAVNSTFSHKILKYFRFVDDIFSGVNDKAAVPDILNFLNSFHTSLEFTFETEVDPVCNSCGPTLAFLDVLIERKLDCCICTHYIKASQTSRSLNFNSAHPPHVLKGILVGEVNRSLNLCSLAADIKKEKARIFQKYLENDYPPTLILEVLGAWKMKQTEPVGVLKKKRKDEIKKWVNLPYIPEVNPFLKKEFKKMGVGVYSQTTCSIKTEASRPWSQLKCISSVPVTNPTLLEDKKKPRGGCLCSTLSGL